MRIEWKGDLAKKIAQQAGMEGLKIGAEHLLTISQKEIPLDTGTLMRSGTVTPIKNGVSVSYNTPYAIKQHEDLNLSHPNGRKAKYLEDPFNENKQRIIDFVKQKIHDTL